MVDARLVAVVFGVVGAVFGIAGLILDAPALGVAAGVAAIGAGMVSLWATPSNQGAPDASEILERDRAIDRTRAELAEARTEIEALRVELDATHPSATAEPAVQPTEPTEEVDRGPDGGHEIGVETSESAMDERTAAAESTEAGAGTTRTPVPGLTDTDSQLFSEAYFSVSLQSRLASARRHLRPVSVCLIEVIEGQVDSVGGAVPAARVADAIRQTLREADIACRMDDGTFAVILEDTPENGAVWTVERTRRNLVSRFGPHTMWAGVACYPAHAFSGEELIEQARAALRSAQEWNQDRIEVAAVES